MPHGKDRTRTDKPLRAQGTDLWAITHSEELYPLVFCHLKLDGRIDISRLKDAITQSCLIVPELLCSFDRQKGRWIDRGFTADAAVIEDARDLGEGWRWDLLSGTQLKVSVCHHAQGDSLLVAFSHILSDGAGFKQYLYLLADIYNGDSGAPVTQTRNSRDIRLFLGGLHSKPLLMAKHSRAAASRRLPFDDREDGGGGTQDTEHSSCLHECLSSDELAALKAHVKSLGCTVNDALLAAYARTAARILDTNLVVLPCPTDLRQHFTLKPELTIANMTGAYTLSITVGANDGFDAILTQVHESLRLQKEHRRCFANTRTVGLLCDMLPSTIAQALVGKFSYVLPLSYTNMGIIDDQRLRFESCTVTDCHLTGSYRRPPGFQLSVSTFRDKLTLCTTTLAPPHTRPLYQNTLHQIKTELQTR